MSTYIKPDIGRGCAFTQNENGESVAYPNDRCYKLHETPWQKDYPDNEPTNIFEIRFKNTRRSYFQNVNNLDLQIGDIVVVEGNPGQDVGTISLTGDMVARQIKRVGFTPYNGEYKKIFRKARSYDIERWQEAIALEHETMIRSRQIAAEMGLDMKIGDVEYQGDGNKAIFYYIADGRVDFRELIKVFAEQFGIRIEMKQIGARQEAGRIGGIGACGRELCCASWMSSFSSVTTNAARLQDLSLNPQMLAGQCSKLKCCLMHEYDVYADARRSAPHVKEPLHTLDGDYFLVKTDVLARIMLFSTSSTEMVNLVAVPMQRVKDILYQNRNGNKPATLLEEEGKVEEPSYRHEEDSITRFDKTRKHKRNHRERNRDLRHSEDNSSEKQSASVENAPKRENSDETVNQKELQADQAGERPQRDHQRRRFNKHHHHHRNPNNNQNQGE